MLNIARLSSNAASNRMSQAQQRSMCKNSIIRTQLAGRLSWHPAVGHPAVRLYLVF